MNYEDYKKSYGNIEQTIKKLSKNKRKKDNPHQTKMLNQQKLSTKKVRGSMKSLTKGETENAKSKWI